MIHFPTALMRREFSYVRSRVCKGQFDSKDFRYGRILVGIRKGRTEKTQERIKRILEIILTARRPLRIHELQGALSIRIQDMSVEFMRRRSMTPFNELCGPLVEVHADDAVSLVHPTAKQYTRSVYRFSTPG